MKVPVVPPHGADVFHLVTTRAHYFPTANSHEVIGIQSVEEHLRWQTDTEHKHFEERPFAFALEEIHQHHYTNPESQVVEPSRSLALFCSSRAP